jgi:hypothetical protein
MTRKETRMISRKNLEFIHIDNLARFQFHFTRDTAETFYGTELAFTLAKNATKPNPFEIILHTTRKENKWKTKEALARAAVTLETERIKGYNP